MAAVRKEVFEGKVCPYCNKDARLVDSAVVYGKSYGLIYFCEPCRAWVGVHKGTENALGRLANAELREWKKQAHALFDPLWNRKMKQGISKKRARAKAYKWLAGELGIDPKRCHIGMFDVDQCRQVVQICKQYYK